MKNKNAHSGFVLLTGSVNHTEKREGKRRSDLTRKLWLVGLGNNGETLTHEEYG